MPTQRPFLSNFLAAFRAHSAPIPKGPPSIPTSGAAASAATIWTTTPSQQLASKPTSDPPASSPKPINPKSNNPSTSTTTAPQDRQFVQSLPPLQHNVSPSTHLPRSPSSSGLPIYGPSNKPTPSYPSVQDVRRSRRRGSDSSSDSGGFREPANRGGEKWFIGGLTASGEERYYKLSMVKRDRSADRISTDQLSL